MKKSLVQIVVLLTVTIGSLYAQTPEKNVNTDPQVWLGFFNQTRISDKLGLWLDVHYRRGDDFIGKPTVGIFRPGITYHISDKVRATVGYAYVNHFPGRGHENISQPEHRSWQQLQWMQKYKSFGTMQWIRLEQRYRRKIKDSDELANGYNFNYKLRYNFSVFIPLKGKEIVPKSLFLSMNDELHINFGKQIVFNYFDQNRAFIGLGYQISDHSNVQLGYMNVFQQLSSGNRYNNVHAVRLFLFYNLDFRNPEN